MVRQPSVRAGENLPDHALAGGQVVPAAGRQVQDAFRLRLGPVGELQVAVCGQGQQRQVVVNAEDAGRGFGLGELVSERDAVSDSVAWHAINRTEARLSRAYLLRDRGGR